MSHKRLLSAVIVLTVMASLGLAGNALGADAPTGTVQFKIVDAETGEEIGGLIWDTPPGAGAKQVVLDLSIQDSIDWPVGSDSVQVSSGSYGDYRFLIHPNAVWGTEFEVNVVEGETTVVTVEMPPPARIRFRAVDDRTGEPLPSVEVFQIASVAGLPTTVTTTNGWVSIDAHADVESTLSIGVGNRQALVSLDAAVAGELLNIADEVRVPSAPLFRGTVTDPDGNPVAGARVDIVKGSSRAADSQIFQTTTTNSTGQYELSPTVDGWRAEFFPPDDRPDLGAFGINDRGSTPRWMTSWRFEPVNVSLPRGRWTPGRTERTEPTASDPITIAATRLGNGAGVNIIWSDVAGTIGLFETRNASGVLVDIHRSLVPEGFVPKGCGSCRLTHQTTLGPWGYQVQLRVPSVEIGLFQDTEPIFLDPPASWSPPHQFTISSYDGCAINAQVELQWFEEEMGPRPVETTTLPSSLPATVTFEEDSPPARRYRVTVDGHDYVSLTIGSLPGAPDWRIGTGAPDCPRVGYAVVTAAGGVFDFGDVKHQGDATSARSPVVAIDLSLTGNGYWVLTEDGTVVAFGDAAHHGDLDPGVLGPNERPTTFAATPSGRGYWVITTAGRVVAFGDAVSFGDLTNFNLAGDIIAAAATPSGGGYYLVGSDGGIFAFGDATFVDSIPGVLPGVTLNEPIVGLTPDPDGNGYWLVAADGGVFAFSASFRGSIPSVLPPGRVLAQPINGMVPYGNGYLLVARDGGVFNFSDLAFSGSLGDVDLDSPIVAISAL